MDTPEIIFEVVAVPTLAKGPVTLGAFRTATEALAWAQRMAADWPPGVFKLEIKEISDGPGPTPSPG